MMAAARPARATTRALMLALVPVLLLLAGCGRQEVYGKLTEGDANEMVAVHLSVEGCGRERQLERRR
jgi:type III secretory pathway lipoprotein EscJ